MTSSEVEDIRRATARCGFGAGCDNNPTLRRLRRRAPAAATARRPAPSPVPDRFNFDLVAAAPPTLRSRRRCRRRPSSSAPAVAVLVWLPGRRPGPWLCLAGARRAIRGSLPAAPGRCAAARHAEPRLLCPLRGAVHARGVRGQAPHIRAIKRFMTDYYYASHPSRSTARRKNERAKEWPSSGPARPGLSAAYFLAQHGLRGHRLRGRSRSGRHAALRHPLPIACQRCSTAICAISRPWAWRSDQQPVERCPAAKAQGFDAVFIAIGTTKAQEAQVPGEAPVRRHDPMTFLTAVHCGTTRPRRQERGRGRRRRQRRHRRGPHGAAPGRGGGRAC